MAGTAANGGGGSPVSCPGPGGHLTASDAGETSGGVVVPCPASPPSGCCSVENLSCAYPTESCVCGNGSWTCYACPATQPTTPNEGADALTDRRLWMTCQYGAVTCSYPSPRFGSLFEMYGANQWTCGVCPAGRPDDGAACGNTLFECRYGSDTCRCGGADGWKCGAPSCETARGAINSGDHACAAPGHFTCQFPALDQVCTCGVVSDARRCSCPGARPANGSPCMAYAGHDGLLSTCTYGDTTCNCLGTTWQCMTPICPPAPAPGTACSMELSCSYGATICFCNGASWSCS